MKRMLALSLACALLVGSLAGCSGTGTKTADASPAVSSASESGAVSTPQVDQSADASANSAAASSAAGSGAVSSSAASAQTTQDAGVPGTAGGGSDNAKLVAEVDSADAFDGCYEFQADQTGTYSFGSQYDGTYDYSKIGYDLGQITWKVFVLDDKFDDAPRFLGQAYTPVLTDDGQTTIKKGQYVYCICSMNAFSADQAVTGIATLDIYLQS